MISRFLKLEANSALKPINPKSDQHLISPCSITADHLLTS